MLFTRPMRFASLPLLLVLVFSFSSVGCTDHSESLCDKALAGVKKLQRQHLSSPPELNADAFLKAQQAILRQYRVESEPSSLIAPQKQCAATLAALHKTRPKTAPSEFVFEIVKHYVRTWDPHTTLLTDAEAAGATSLREGFGFSLARAADSGDAEVIDVIAGSPAHSAGLSEGMFVSGINGTDIRALSVSTIKAIVNDKKSSRIVLEITSDSRAKAQSSPRSITVFSETFEASPLKLDTFPGGSNTSIGYLKLRSFVGAEAFFAEALKSLRNSVALILDLRDNSGGEIQAAANIGDQLISGGDSFVGFSGRKAASIEILPMKNPGSIWDGPIVVLVNENTKSAAEVLAGALQDYGAVVVGGRTFGKGTRQIRISLSEFGLPGAIELTDAFTVRPSGKMIQSRGIQPDILVSLAANAHARREDDYSNPLPARGDQEHLIGYDPSAMPLQKSAFQKKLAELDSQIQTNLQAKQHIETPGEDAQLDAARQVANFLARGNY